MWGAVPTFSREAASNKLGGGAAEAPIRKRWARRRTIDNRLKILQLLAVITRYCSRVNAVDSETK